MLELNIQKEDNDAVLNSLIDLAEHRPKYLRSQLERLLEVLLKVNTFSLSMCECNMGVCLALRHLVMVYTTESKNGIMEFHLYPINSWNSNNQTLVIKFSIWVIGYHLLLSLVYG